MISFLFALRDPNASLSQCARTAYKSTLSSHHGILVRSVVKTALLLLPSRKHFEKTLKGGKEVEAPAFQAMLAQFGASIQTVEGALEKLL